MSARIRRLAAPASGGYLPVPGTSSGSAAAAALANHANAGVPVGVPAGATGNILIDPLDFVPNTNAFLISWSVSGASSIATSNTTFTVNVRQGLVITPFQSVTVSPGGDGTTTFASGTAIVTGYAPGVPVAINIGWITSAGTFQPSERAGGVVVTSLM